MLASKAEVRSFIKDAGWDGCSCQPFASDFSTRIFARLTKEDTGEIAVLMRADDDQRTEPFVHLANLLRRIDIAAPSIYASDFVRGLVLMQDFGTDNVGLLLDAGMDRDPFDQHAVKLLSVLHLNFRQEMLGVSKTSLYNAALFSDQVTLFLDHYYPKIFHRLASAQERSGFVEAWHTVLSPLDSLPRSLLLRDFMPDNMIALQSPVLGHDVGVVDFQDAGIGPIAYDIASWCESVRRDGGVELLPHFVSMYHKLNPAISEKELLDATYVYAAQRHARVLGILVKLNRMEHLPRVWTTLQKLLQEEALAPVKQWFLSCPPPNMGKAF